MLFKGTLLFLSAEIVRDSPIPYRANLQAGGELLRAMNFKLIKFLKKKKVEFHETIDTPSQFGGKGEAGGTIDRRPFDPSEGETAHLRDTLARSSWGKEKWCFRSVSIG